MTHEEAVDALTQPIANATYSGVQELRSDLREWARGLTRGERMLVVSRIAGRRCAAEVHAELDRLADQ